MQILVGLASIILLSLIYFGFFPAIYILIKQNKTRLAWVLLLSSLLLCGGMFRTAISGNAFVSMFLVSFIGSGFFFTVGLVRGLSLIKASLAAYLPVLIYGAFLMLQPGIYADLEALTGEFLARLELPQDALVKTLDKAHLQIISHVISRLFVSLTILDLSFRLFIGSLVLARIQKSKNIRLQVPILSDIAYPNWPIWVVAAGLGGLFLSLYFPSWFSHLIWASFSILIVVSPFFLIRGGSVISWKVKKLQFFKSWPMYLKLFLLLIIFWIWLYIFAAMFILGVLDTWLDFRKTGKPLDEKR